MVQTERRPNLTEYLAGLARSSTRKSRQSRNDEIVELRSLNHHQPVHHLQIHTVPFTFKCQLSKGGRCEQINLSNFKGVEGLYKELAECLEVPLDSILFCTVNTHKPNMNNLLMSKMAIGDHIYVHTRGQPKEVEILKSETVLGLTITDNGAGKAIVKRIKADSIMSRLHGEHVLPGDFIEKIDGVSCVGKRHFEVSKMLREARVGQTLIVRFVEPLKDGFTGINFSRTGSSNRKVIEDEPRQTIRIKANGLALVHNQTDQESKVIDAVNNLLEDYMGISDSDLAQTIYEISAMHTNPSDFVEQINTSDLALFGFSIEFMFDLWGAINDIVRMNLKNKSH